MYVSCDLYIVYFMLLPVLDYRCSVLLQLISLKVICASSQVERMTEV